MKAAVKMVSTAWADAEKQLTSFMDKFEPKNQALIRALRKVLRKRLPIQLSEMHCLIIWVFLIGSSLPATAQTRPAVLQPPSFGS